MGANLAMLTPKLFSSGIHPARVSMSTKPERGVIIVGDSARARSAGIQAGDIIVGLEGVVRVDNLDQYFAVNASYEKSEMKFTLWRGSIFQVTTSSPTRLLGIPIRSHPIAGWGE